MPEFIVAVPNPLSRPIAANLIPTRSVSKVVAAETTSETRWEVRRSSAGLGQDTFQKSGAALGDDLSVPAGHEAVATSQKTKVVGAVTVTRTRWEAGSAGAAGLTLDRFMAAPCAPGTAVIAVKNLDLKAATLKSQSSRVTAAETATATHWEMGADGKAVPIQQKSRLEAFETFTRSLWNLK